MKIYVVGSSNNKFLPMDCIREQYLVNVPHANNNIDFLNSRYCELTGLYYLYRNVDDSIKGLEHYRRYFCTEDGSLLNESSITDILSTHDVIMYKNPYSVAYDDMAATGKQTEIELLADIVDSLDKNFGEFFRHRIKQRGTYEGNMMICRAPLFNHYCSVLFGKVLRIFDAVHQFRTPRIDGYISEYFLGPYMEYNKLTIFDCKRIVYTPDFKSSEILG